MASDGHKHTLEDVGLDDFWSEDIKRIKEQGFEPARVSLEQKENYMVLTTSGELQAEVTGKFMYTANNSTEYPKVGDWVAVSTFNSDKKAIIHEVLTRRNRFSRVAAGNTKKEQVIATNIDVLLVVQGLDQNYNLKRLHRYVAMAKELNVEPVVVLNKSDVCTDSAEKKEEVINGCAGVRAIVSSSVTADGMEELKGMIKKGMTFMMAGSSGVGKSTLINLIAGHTIEKTAEVREGDSRGRHTTVHRHMIVLDEGGVFIDTPGMREFGIWDIKTGISETFPEIEDLASMCRYSDCTHTVENKCAVIAAVEKNEVPGNVYDSYVKMQKEQVYLNSKENKAAFFEQKKKEKQLARTIKNMYKIGNKKRKPSGGGTNA